MGTRKRAAKTMLRFRLEIGQRGVFVLLVLFVMSYSPTRLQTESSKLTTYYPAPYGAYQELRSTQGTYLSYGGAGNQVAIGTLTPPAGPKLFVAGQAQVRNLLADTPLILDTVGATPNIRAGAGGTLALVSADDGAVAMRVGPTGGNVSFDNQAIFFGRIGVGVSAPGAVLEVAPEQGGCDVVLYDPSPTACPAGEYATFVNGVRVASIRGGSAGSQMLCCRP